MKKITFILLALISGTAFAQDAKATATVNAEIVQPISIVVDGSTLDFGTIDGGVGEGTVLVALDGKRSSIDNDQLIIGDENGSAATFQITAATDFAYTVSIADITLTGSNGGSMGASFIHEVVGGEKGTGTTQELTVGGELKIGETQPVGSYTGTVNVSVDYN